MKLNFIYRGLDVTYRVLAFLGAICIVGMGVTVMVSIASRALSSYIPGLTHLAGYLMALGHCFAMAYTFRRGGHIRIEILISKLSLKRQKMLEKAALILSFFVITYIAFYMFRLAYFSWLFNEYSSGARYIMLWPIQSLAAIGISVFSISLAHTLVESFTSKVKAESSNLAGGAVK